MGLLLLALILLLLLGGLPQWPYARGWDWGYRPSGLLGLLLVVVLVMIFLDVIRCYDRQQEGVGIRQIDFTQGMEVLYVADIRA